MENLSYANYPRTPLIVFEGIDGSGKTTLAQRLSLFLRKQECEVVLTKQPGGTPLGMRIREMVQHPDLVLDHKAEFLLFAADRAQQMQEVVVPSLQQGVWVISDRWTDSSIAYQGYGKGGDLHMITTINAWITQGRIPDVTFYIAVDYETAQRRLQERNQQLSVYDKQKKEFFEHVIQGFESLYHDRSNVAIIDGTRSPDEVFSDVVQKLEEILAVSK